MLAEIAAGDFLKLLEAEREVHGRPRDYSAVSWRLLRQAGAFGQRAPESLAQLLTIGQRSPAELVDRYQLTCLPVRDLIVDYLQERQPALRTRPGDAEQPAGQRLASRHTLMSVRAFYLDLACWAAEDPARWGQWAVPSPVFKADTESRKEDRQRKSRMDSRTRERLPVLPVLARSAAGHRDRTAETLKAALAVPPGATFTAAGQSLTRAAPRKTGIRAWAHDRDGGMRLPGYHEPQLSQRSQPPRNPRQSISL